MARSLMVSFAIGSKGLPIFFLFACLLVVIDQRQDALKKA